jgi:6-phosphogluconolactonase
VREDASLVIGTYSRRWWSLRRRPAGILAASHDQAGPAVLADPPNPSWLTTTEDGRYLYAIAETKRFAGGPGGGVRAYAREPATGGLTMLNAMSSGGSEPAYVAVDRSGRFVIVANFGSGSVAVFARETDGRLGPMTGHVQHPGPDAHPHQISFDPATGDLLVPDLGLDAVFRYRLGDDGGLTERTPRIAGAPGAGTRHVAPHPDGQHLFVVNELDSTLVVFTRDGGRFVGSGAVRTVPDGFTRENFPSTVRVSPSGRSVLTANRGHDSIAVFSFDQATGELTPALTAPCGGRWPRDFALSPDGTRLAVANQRSGTVAMFGFDEDEPSLRYVSAVRVHAPACVRFIA